MLKGLRRMYLDMAWAHIMTIDWSNDHERIKNCGKMLNINSMVIFVCRELSIYRFVITFIFPKKT